MLRRIEQSVRGALFTCCFCIFAMQLCCAHSVWITALARLKLPFLWCRSLGNSGFLCLPASSNKEKRRGKYAEFSETPRVQRGLIVSWQRFTVIQPEFAASAAWVGDYFAWPRVLLTRKTHAPIRRCARSIRTRAA